MGAIIGIALVLIFIAMPFVTLAKVSGLAAEIRELKMLLGILIDSSAKTKAKAKVEFGAKTGVSIVNGYTYVDHLSWEAYNESSDLSLQTELYRQRFGILPKEVQADKIYLGKDNRKYIRENHMDCFNHPLGRPPKEENDVHLEDKKRAVGERNEVEATFGTSKRVYRANNIRAKLDETADTWIGACFFAKNVMKFLRGLLRLFFGILGQKPFMGQLYNNEVCLVPVFDWHRQWHLPIN